MPSITHARKGVISVVAPSPYASNPKSNWVVVDLRTLATYSWNNGSTHPTGQVLRVLETSGGSSSLVLNSNTDYLFTTNGQPLTVPFHIVGGRRHHYFNCYFAPTPTLRPDGNMGTPYGWIAGCNPRVGAWFTFCRWEAAGMVTDQCIASYSNGISQGADYYWTACLMLGHRGNVSSLHGDFFQYQTFGANIFLGDLSFDVFTGRHQSEGFALAHNTSGDGMSSFLLRKFNIGLDSRYSLVAGSSYGGDVAIQVDPANLLVSETHLNGGSAAIYNYNTAASGYRAPSPYNSGNQPPTGGLTTGADPAGGDWMIASDFAAATDPWDFVAPYVTVFSVAGSKVTISLASAAQTAPAPKLRLKGISPAVDTAQSPAITMSGAPTAWQATYQFEAVANGSYNIEIESPAGTFVNDGRTVTVNVKSIGASASGGAEPASTITGVSISPPAPQLSAGAAVQVSSTVVGTGAFDPSVTWTHVGPAQFNAATLSLVAPSPAAATQLSGTITATSVQDPTKSATITYTLLANTQPAGSRNVNVVGSLLTDPLGGRVWGSNNVYTDDSDFDSAALHAGLVPRGVGATIKVTDLGSRSNFTSSTSFGVTSESYPGAWPAVSLSLVALVPAVVVNTPNMRGQSCDISGTVTPPSAASTVAVSLIEYITGQIVGSTINAAVNPTTGAFSATFTALVPGKTYSGQVLIAGQPVVRSTRPATVRKVKGTVQAP